MQTLLISLILSALFVPIVYFAGKKSGKRALIIITIMILTDLALLSTTLPTILSQGRYTESYTWIPMLGSFFTLFIDGISFSLVTITLILSLATAVYSLNYLESEENENNSISSYYSLLSLLIVALVGVFMTSTLLEFYIFWELMLIPTYFLIAKWGYSDSKKVAFKFFIFTHVGAVLILLAIGLVFTLTKTLDIFQAGAILATLPIDVVKWVPILFTVGFAVKMAIVPLHMWLPDAHSESPAPISALLSGVLIEAGGYAVYRISIQTVFPAIANTVFGNQFLFALTILGVISAYYGALNALNHQDMKRVIAYSSISHMGYVLFGLSLAPLSPLAAAGALLHLVNHAASKGLFFLTSGSVQKSTGTRDITRLGGLAKSMPLTALSSSIAAFSIAGVPGLACFISEFLMLLGAFESIAANPLLLVPTVLMVGVSVLCAAYSLRLFWKVFLEEPKIEKVQEVPKSMSYTTIGLSMLVILLGVWPRIFLDLITKALG
jgi:NADH-quinone oxidoreductase subunit M